MAWNLRDVRLFGLLDPVALIFEFVGLFGVEDVAKRELYDVLFAAALTGTRM